jgi:riboflavin synthase
MFTGIVEELGVVRELTVRGDSAVLSVAASIVGSDVRHGASISVNGVCLTVIDSHIDSHADVDPAAGPGLLLEFDVMAETLKRSVIGDLQRGEQVNLERAVRVDGRLDGHVVQGHVDGTGVIVARRPGDGWEAVRVGLPVDLSRYVAEKGAIAVDGVSLTITAVGSDWFEVGLIPETLRATTLGRKGVGATVNLETDVLAKYTERLLAHRPDERPREEVSP